MLTGDPGIEAMVPAKRGYSLEAKLSDPEAAEVDGEVEAKCLASGIRPGMRSIRIRVALLRTWEMVSYRATTSYRTTVASPYNLLTNWKG
jgi:hypothetical protein